MKKKYIWIIILTVCVFLASIPYLFALNHIRMLKKNLDNPIINAGYPGWRKVYLDENLRIKLPDYWSLEMGDTIKIYDESQTLVMIGEKYIGDGLLNDHACINKYVGSKVISSRYERFSNNLFGNMAGVSRQFYTFETNEERSFVFIHLPYSKYKQEDYGYYLYFLEDSETNCDLAEAIAYSMED